MVGSKIPSWNYSKHLSFACILCIISIITLTLENVSYLFSAGKSILISISLSVRCQFLSNTISKKFLNKYFPINTFHVTSAHCHVARPSGFPHLRISVDKHLVRVRPRPKGLTHNPGPETQSKMWHFDSMIYGHQEGAAHFSSALLHLIIPWNFAYAQCHDGPFDLAFLVACLHSA